ncbi:MAG TPA: phosphoribosyltransferase family protein [Candidatus Nanoarchaeia archaeon]|nr:phosphoribosyltransferase family protein [Candidatus Nanoarchaeia archaeon]
MVFENRHDAGKQLAKKLEKYKGEEDIIILAIPRGGLEIGFELATYLNVPLDVVISKKIGFPGDPEFAIGAVCYGGEVLLDEPIIRDYNVDESYVKEEIRKLNEAINEKYKKYRNEAKFPELKGKIVILTDDGVATGHTMLAAINFAKKKHAKKIIVAVPVCPVELHGKIEKLVDELVVLDTPLNFIAIGQFYEEFNQVTDEEAIKYLKEANG